MTTDRRYFLATAAGAGAGAAFHTACSAPSTPPVTAKVHVVLLGDSIFDNGRYVSGEPCVIEQFGSELGDRGKCTLLAVDGSVTRDVAAQLARLPADATHVVISSGGNDALRNRSLLDSKITGSAALFVDLAQIQNTFRGVYRQMLVSARATGKPVTVCTIYDSNFEQPEKAVADVALSVWNDTIVRCAREAGVPVIDLRRIFTSRTDYANPIEPSAVGGAKLVKVIDRVVREHDFARNVTTLYP